MENKPFYQKTTFADIINERFSELSSRELAILFAEGTLDKSVRPTRTDLWMERVTVANYLLFHPELRNDFYRGLQELVSKEEFEDVLINLERPSFPVMKIPGINYPLHEN